MALPQQVVMIDQVTLIGKERKRGERPGGGHQSPGPEDGCPTTWLGTIFHISDLGDTQRTPPVPRYLPLRFEVEVALNGVAPAELPDHAILWDVHAVARRLSKVGWRNRNGAEAAVVDGGRAPGGVGGGGQRRLKDSAAPQGDSTACAPSSR